MISWLTGQASKFGDTKLMVAESFNFNHAATDSILNDSTASDLVGVIGGHIYGGGLRDYPLAREKGKEVWMTEHFTDSDNDANAWPNAFNVATEIHNCMAANFSAYIWWYIRRSYGPITENGQVSKRGYMMAQYSKFVRPDFVRVDASVSGMNNVRITAYKDGGNLVVVAVNTGSSSQSLTLHIQNGSVASFTQYTSSGTKNLSEDGTIAVTDHLASVTLDGQSATTFISE
jgi:O-glycosyl hydrolase